jgi:hypothetical protein
MKTSSSKTLALSSRPCDVAYRMKRATELLIQASNLVMSIDRPNDNMSGTLNDIADAIIGLTNERNLLETARKLAAQDKIALAHAKLQLRLDAMNAKVANMTAAPAVSDEEASVEA